MNSPFKIHDVAVIHSQTGQYAHMNDEEVTITGPLAVHNTIIGPVMSYAVSHPEYPQGLFAKPNALRLKSRGDSDWKMKWGEGVWMPDPEMSKAAGRVRELRAQLGQGGVARS